MQKNELKFVSALPEYRYMDQLKTLYHDSFPKAERKPFEMIEEKFASGQMDVLAVEKDEQLCALAFVILDDDFVILDYLAVMPKLHSQHIGSDILQQLQKRYQQPLIVEIESTFDSEDDQKQRRRRFYIKNGFQPNPYEISLFGVDMEVLSTKPASFQEYFDVLSRHFGWAPHEYVRKLRDLKES